MAPGITVRLHRGTTPQPTPTGDTTVWVDWTGNAMDYFQWQILVFNYPQTSGTPVASSTAASPIATPRFVDGLTPGKKYMVVGWFKAGSGSTAKHDYWTSGTAVELDYAPKEPPAPTLNNATATSIDVNWQKAAAKPAVDYNEVSILAYESPSPTLESHDDTNGSPGGWGSSVVAPNTRYYVITRSHNIYGKGDWSERLLVQSLPDGINAPTSAEASRQSDSRVNVSWTRNTTGTRPYDSQQIDRQVDGGAWSRVANLSGTPSSFTDTSTAANHKFRYRVRAVNASGASPWAYTGYVVTTPRAPSSVVASRASGNSVKLTWNNNVNYPNYTTAISESDGAGGWVYKTSVAAGVTTWTDTDPRSGITQYQLSTTNTDDTVPYPLTSGRAQSNSVIGIAPPLAPTQLVPNGEAIDAAEDQTFTWRHNPQDGSAQTAYQVRWRETGGTWTTGAKTDSGNATTTFVADTFTNGEHYEWQVRTWGADTDPGDWSSTATFTAADRPVAGITAPDAGTYGFSAVTVEWTYFQAQSSAQVAWEAQLLDANDGDAQLEALSGFGDDASATFATILADDHDYKIRVRVVSNDGLWSSWGQITVNVSYLPPAAVDLTATYDPDSASVVLALSAQDAEDGVTVPVTSVDVYRRVDSGEWHAVALGLDPDTTLIDTQPTIYGTNEYRVVGRSDIPSSADQGAPTVVGVSEGRRGWLSSGPAFDRLVSVDWRLTLAATAERAKAVQHFAGRARPVEMVGDTVDEAHNITGIVNTREGLAVLRDIITGPDAVLWRDPTGLRVYGSAGKLSFAPFAHNRNWWEVSFTVTRTDHDEH